MLVRGRQPAGYGRLIYRFWLIDGAALEDQDKSQKKQRLFIRLRKSDVRTFFLVDRIRSLALLDALTSLR